MVCDFSSLFFILAHGCSVALELVLRPISLLLPAFLCLCQSSVRGVCMDLIPVVVVLFFVFLMLPKVARFFIEFFKFPGLLLFVKTSLVTLCSLNLLVNYRVKRFGYFSHSWFHCSVASEGLFPHLNFTTVIRFRRNSI